MTFPILTAVGTGRIIDVNALAAPLACLCYAQATQAAAEPAEAALRAVYPEASDLLIAHVIDLHAVPSLFRGVAEGILRSEYEKAVRALPEGRAPYDYTIVLPDWDGSFIRQTGLDDVAVRLGIAAFGEDGSLRAKAQEEDPVTAVLDALTTRR